MSDIFGFVWFFKFPVLCNCGFACTAYVLPPFYKNKVFCNFFVGIFKLNLWRILEIFVTGVAEILGNFFTVQSADWS